MKGPPTAVGGIRQKFGWTFRRLDMKGPPTASVGFSDFCARARSPKRVCEGTC
jgi:hypothetical protein